MIKTALHDYTDGRDRFVGRLVWDDAISEAVPGVLVAPAFGGLGPFEEERAIALAELGYVALAVDYYGDGKRASGEEEAYALMRALDADRDRLARRMVAALNELKRQDRVEAESVGAMGYCFGGKAVLDLARTGERFDACACFHGVYDAPDNSTSAIVPSVMVFHGWDDPLAPPDDFTALAAELTEKCTDWQMQAFGHTGHAFTNPNAQSPDAGMMYSQRTALRSWESLITFFDETLRA